ncbi:MAG TPA: hypothetical protein VGC53_13850 [Vicinamibacteria bacterium]|jgi:hypothetical protein
MSSRAIGLGLGITFGALLVAPSLGVTNSAHQADTPSTQLSEPQEGETKQLQIHIEIAYEIQPLDSRCEEAVADLTAELEKQDLLRLVDFPEDADARLLVQDCWVYNKAVAKVDSTRGGTFVPDPDRPDKGAFVNWGSVGVQNRTEGEFAFHVRLIAGNKFEDFLPTPKDETLSRAVRTVNQGINKWLQENGARLAGSRH